MQDQLRQSQKLESIGRLAGGVAHDFNNLLTVINGYADLIAGGLDPQDSLWSSIDEIRKAGQRAAGLTRQLLTLSRTQIIQYGVTLCGRPSYKVDAQLDDMHRAGLS